MTAQPTARLASHLEARPMASHLVNGACLQDAGCQPFDVIHPATAAVIARLHAAIPAVIDGALAGSVAALAAWAGLRPVERGRSLHRAAAIIRDRNPDLARLETPDTGKPIREALVADWPYGADALKFFEGPAATVTGEGTPLGRDFVCTMREPPGVCAGIGALNYPRQIACRRAAPALATGNAVVFRPSEVTPLDVLQLAAIPTGAALPPGLFSVVQRMAAMVAALATDPRVADVSRTGSVQTGARVCAPPAAGMKHVTMEQGGNPPQVLFDDAGLARAHRVAARLQAGMGWRNARTLTPVEARSGGVDASGIGGEYGKAAVAQFTQARSVCFGTARVGAPC